MKTIKLKVYKEPVANNGQDTEVAFTTLSLLRTAVKVAPEGGWEEKAMRKRIRLLDAFDSHAETFPFEGLLEKAPENYLDRTADLLLEDADFDELKAAMGTMRWTILSKGITETYDQLNGNT